MAAIRSKATKPELLLRNLLSRFNLEVLYNVASLPGKPDVYVKCSNLAIFVNGCFWHSHSNCKFASKPKSNVTFWLHKLENNVKRDKSVRRRLNRLGIRTMTVWECQLNKHTIEKVYNRLVTSLCLSVKKNIKS